MRGVAGITVSSCSDAPWGHTKVDLQEATGMVLAFHPLRQWTFQPQGEQWLTCHPFSKGLLAVELREGTLWLD